MPCNSSCFGIKHGLRLPRGLLSDMVTLGHSCRWNTAALQRLTDSYELGLQCLAFSRDAGLKVQLPSAVRFLPSRQPVATWLALALVECYHSHAKCCPSFSTKDQPFAGTTLSFQYILPTNPKSYLNAFLCCANALHATRGGRQGDPKCRSNSFATSMRQSFGCQKMPDRRLIRKRQSNSGIYCMSL